MTTTDTPMTQQEFDNVVQFFKDHNIAWLDQLGNFNGEVFGKYFDYWSEVAKKEIKFTPENLALAFKEFQRSGTELHHYSPEETQFHIFEEQLGPATTGLVIKELGRHGLENTAGTENLFRNFSAVVRYYQSQGWQISADSFGLAIGNLRTSLGHGTLVYKPTPSQQASAKRWETTRNSESRKSLLEIAKEKAANVRHVFNPDGTRMSDTIMRQFYENHPEFLESETSQTPATPSVDEAYEGYWERQTKEYIRSINGNLLQQEAEQSFGKLHGNNSWRQTYMNLTTWHEQKKAEKPGLWV